MCFYTQQKTAPGGELNSACRSWLLVPARRVPVGLIALSAQSMVFIATTAASGFEEHFCFAVTIRSHILLLLFLFGNNVIFLTFRQEIVAGRCLLLPDLVEPHCKPGVLQSTLKKQLQNGKSDDFKNKLYPVIGLEMVRVKVETNFTDEVRTILGKM